MWPRKRPGSPGGAIDDGGFEQCAPLEAGTRASGGAFLPSATGDEEKVAESRESGESDSRVARSMRGGGRNARGGEAPAPLTAAQLRMKGIALLARREHSRSELQQKLKRYSEDAELIVSVLDQLQQEKLLSDARYAESVARVRGARYGSARVAQDLRARGVSGETAAGLVQALRATDAERAQEAWQKRFGEPAQDAAGRAKQMRFLQSRGFSPEVIRRVVPRAQAASADDED